MKTKNLLTKKQINNYQQNGVIPIYGLFKPWIKDIARGIKKNIDSPGIYFGENTKPDEKGRFFEDYCNWNRIKEFERVVFDSPIANIASLLMNSLSVQFFHDHVLVKEAQTETTTPWHQDAPYYFVDGEQTVSFWIPIDPVKENSLRFIAGSHKWKRPVIPTRWLSEENFYADKNEYRPIPDPDFDSENFKILHWDLEPGDVIAFNFKTVHGAKGNFTDDTRRALSLRFFGDDSRYIKRPGATSPPFPGHQMKSGQKLRSDWFPFIPIQ